MDFENYTTKQENVDESSLQALTSLAKEAKELEDEMKGYETAIKALKERYRDITEKSIPDMMAQLHLSEFKLDTGQKVTTKEFVSGSLPKDDRRATAIEWLEQHGAGELIETQVGMKFRRSEHDKAQEIAEKLRLQGYEVQADSNVHHSTLCSFARERMALGETIPLDILGLYAGRKAVIK